MKDSLSTTPGFFLAPDGWLDGWMDGWKDNLYFPFFFF
jgi:hypothetical protein